jgi:predicted RNA binding protein YcfA (HicA-like mRNA interferase family)
MRLGYVYDRNHGDHRIYTRPGASRPIVIPTYDELDIDIIKSNLRTAKISRENYFRLLNEC